MNYLAYHENQPRGTFDFPIAFYYVDPAHSRYRMPFHWHMEFEMILVLSGSFTLSLGTDRRELHPGDAAFIPDGVIHGGTPHDCVYECVVFDFGRFLQENAIGGKTRGDALNSAAQRPRFFEKDSQECHLIDTLFETMEKETPGYEFSTAGLLWQLMGLLVRQATLEGVPPIPRDKRTEQMKRVLRRIRQNYAEPLTLDDLAAEAGMTAKYFCRAFRKVTGRTPIDYVNYYRVECAGELLCATNESITEIALSCGFNDLSYFARAFRKYKGVSAQQYRQAQK